MNYTLKNRPHNFSTQTYDQEAIKQIMACYTWFEGFEKQETKRLSDAEFAQMDLEKTEKTAQRRAYYEGYIDAKKEVLGE